MESRKVDSEHVCPHFITTSDQKLFIWYRG